MNPVLSTNELVLVVHLTLLKQSVMQKLDGTNIIIQLKIRHYRNTFKTISTTALHGLIFKMFQKTLRPERT